MIHFRYLRRVAAVLLILLLIPSVPAEEVLSAQEDPSSLATQAQAVESENAAPVAETEPSVQETETSCAISAGAHAEDTVAPEATPAPASRKTPFLCTAKHLRPRPSPLRLRR